MISFFFFFLNIFLLHSRLSWFLSVCDAVYSGLKSTSAPPPPPSRALSLSLYLSIYLSPPLPPLPTLALSLSLSIYLSIYLSPPLSPPLLYLRLQVYYDSLHDKYPQTVYRNLSLQRNIYTGGKSRANQTKICTKREERLNLNRPTEINEEIFKNVSQNNKSTKSRIVQPEQSMQC